MLDRHAGVADNADAKITMTCPASTKNFRLGQRTRRNDIRFIGIAAMSPYELLLWSVFKAAAINWLRHKDARLGAALA